MGRVEEILEVALIARNRNTRPPGLERSSAGELHDPESLREMAHRELEFAAVDIGCLAFGEKRMADGHGTLLALHVAAGSLGVRVGPLVGMLAERGPRACALERLNVPPAYEPESNDRGHSNVY